MRYGQMTLGREQSARLLGWGIRFFFAAALSASQTVGGYAPFALGAVAAAGPGADGAAALAGAAAGALLFMDFANALPFLASGVLVLTAATAFSGSRMLSGRMVMPLTTAGISLAVSGIYVVQSLSPADQLTPCVAAAALTGVSVWFFRPLLRGEETPRTADGLLFLAAALLLALQELELLGLSLGRMLLCVLLAYTAYERGAAAGASAGLGLGLVTDLCIGSGSGIFTAGFGLAGLAAGSRAGRRRIGAAAAFLAAVGAVLLPVRVPLAQPLLLEAIAGAGVFLLLPERLFGGKRVKRDEGREESAAGSRLREQLNRMAVTLRDLYDCMGRNVPASTDENPAVVFDRAAEKVCRDCAICELCWQKEYTGTFNALNDATPILLERGRAMAKDFPGYFASRCIHLPDLITEINGELSAFLLRRQYRRQLDETRRSAQGQYAQLSELLTAAAAGLGATEVMGQAEGCCRVGAVLRPREGENVCGDTLMSFRNDCGQWCLLLADGMGSGEEARRESALTCRLLRQFLEAGIEPEAALKTLNSAMALRGAETGSFTTIDLCICGGDGTVSFYKYGAAPSYLKKGGTVRRVTGGGLPAGLRGAPVSPDVTRVTLEEGGFVVMISDGVADAGRDEWLMNLLAGWQGEDPQTLAGLILTESIRRERLQDDCGIQVLYREKGGAKPV